MIKYKLENSFHAYQNLAKAYMSKHDEAFLEVISVCYEEFERDGNVGLIKKLQKAFSKVRISELSETYLTLQYK